jgi:hypothetical protein
MSYQADFYVEGQKITMVTVSTLGTPFYGNRNHDYIHEFPARQLMEADSLRNAELGASFAICFPRRPDDGEQQDTQRYIGDQHLRGFLNRIRALLISQDGNAANATITGAL